MKFQSNANCTPDSTSCRVNRFEHVRGRGGAVEQWVPSWISLNMLEGWGLYSWVQMKQVWMCRGGGDLYMDPPTVRQMRDWTHYLLATSLAGGSNSFEALRERPNVKSLRNCAFFMCCGEEMVLGPVIRLVGSSYSYIQQESVSRLIVFIVLLAPGISLAMWCCL